MPPLAFAQICESGRAIFDPIWPMEHYFTGVKSEKPYSQEFLSLLPSQWHGRVIDLTGELLWSNFWRCFPNCRFLLPMIPVHFIWPKRWVLAPFLYGGRVPLIFMARYQKEKEFHDVIYKRYPCSPCLYVYRTDAGYFCGQKAPCMQAIEPLDVLMVIHQRLGN